MKNLWLKIKNNWKKTVFAILGISVAYAAFEVTSPVGAPIAPEVLEYTNWIDPDTKANMVTYSIKGKEYIPQPGEMVREFGIIKDNRNGTFTGRFFAGSQFIKEGDKWFYREHRIVPKLQFETEHPIGFLERFFHGIQQAYADTFVSAVDGFVSRDLVGTTEAWATIRAGSGNQANSSAATFRVVFGEAEEAGGGNNFDYIRRGALAFLTGNDIPGGSTIVSCTLSLTAERVSTGLGNSPDIVISSTSGAWTTSLAQTDYETHGNTEYSDQIDAGAFVVGTPKIFTCTADGRTNVGTGAGIYTRFMMKTDFDLADSPVPSTNVPQTQQEDGVWFWAIEHTDASLEPIFTVTWTAGGAAEGEDDQDIIQFMYWKLYDFKVFAYYNLFPLIQTAYAWF